MIEHVYRRATAAPGVDRVVVLTDDERVATAVTGFGGEWEMTPGDCASGTDRIAWAAARWSGATAIINVQGDEPLIEPGAIGRLAGHLAANPDDPVVTLAAPDDEAILTDPDVVKVVVSASGRALYFSRAPIPFPRHDSKIQPLRHVGIYGYQAAALQQLAALPPSPLEGRESLEQLRALENDIPIRVLLIDRAAPGVDNESDLERVEAILRQTGEGA